MPAYLRRVVRLEGYWQLERYFRAIAPAIRNELEIVSSLSAKSQDVAGLIANTQSVCFHVRQILGASCVRQACLTYPQLPFSYYEEAVARLVHRVESPTFFFVCDNFD